MILWKNSGSGNIKCFDPDPAQIFFNMLENFKKMPFNYSKRKRIQLRSFQMNIPGCTVFNIYRFFILRSGSGTNNSGSGYRKKFRTDPTESGFTNLQKITQQYV